MSDSKEKDKAADDNLDADGLVIQKFNQQVLVVVPPGDYDEITMRYARSALLGLKVATPCASTNEEDLLKGEQQDELQADGLLADAKAADYSGVIFCGGPGALGLVDDADALRLAREATEGNLLIGAWGEGLSILAAAGVLKGKRVAAPPTLEKDLKAAGARRAGAQIGVDGLLITAPDDSAGFRFARALAEHMPISAPLN